MKKRDENKFRFGNEYFGNRFEYQDYRLIEEMKRIIEEIIVWKMKNGMEEINWIEKKIEEFIKIMSLFPSIGFHW